VDPPFDPLRYIASYADLIRAFGTNAELGRRHWETSGKSEGRDPNRFDPTAYAAANADLARLYGFDASGLTLHYLSSGFSAGRPIGGFDAIAYAAANADLARVFGADPARLTTHWIGNGVHEGRRATGFDHLGYAAANPAVARLLGADAPAVALHYVSEGARAGLRIGIFDPLAYGAANADLARQFGTDARALTDHFIGTGAKAGLPTSGFDAIAYAAVNVDLARVFGANGAALTLHWLGNGADEGRATSGFDALAYAAANPQLAKTYGANASALALHYVTEGARAGLKTSGFDAIAYAAANPDLARAFGANVPALLTHFVTRGVHEGRVTSGFDAIAYAAANPELARLYGADAQALTVHYVTTGLRAGLKTGGFDGLGYAWANPDVGRALGLDPSVLALHFVTEGAQAGLATPRFDPIAYAAANPDLARIFGASPAALTDHFVRAGFAEGRAISGFDPLAYAAANPDLVRTHGWNAALLTTHFVTTGAAQGLQRFGFDAIAYGAANPDLARVYGADLHNLTLHWVTKGIREGRATSGFDTIDYAAANGAVVLEVGLDPGALALHYVDKGLRAGLPTGGFDPVAYLLSNSDLMASGIGAGAAFTHWLNNGIEEGRTGDALFGREQPSHALALGAPAESVFATAADRDWYEATLSEGQSYVVELTGADGAPLDAQIRIHDSGGRLLAFRNTAGAGEALLAFTPSASGSYYVALASSGQAGDYRLSVASAPTLDEDGPVSTAAGDLIGPEFEGWTLTGVEGVAVPEEGVTIQGVFGALTVAADGGWSYALDDWDPDTNRLLAGEVGSERFDYVRESDGEAAAATLRLFIRGSADFEEAASPFRDPTIIGSFPRQYFMPSIADFDADGWLEPFGFLADGLGGFLPNPAAQLPMALRPDRVNRDARIFDIDGDGHVDAVMNVYSSPSLEASFGLVLLGDGAGGFAPEIERRDLTGFGETILSADFDNDGDLDVFVPVYTHAGTSPSTYLLFNEGGVLGENRALEFGVGLADQPAPLRVEGAQAVDVDFDGRIDLFTASHLFLNEGGHFREVVLDPQRFDEGAKLFDYDNDGDFDLVLMDEHQGPALYEWESGRFVSRGLLGSGGFNPGVSLNVYDVDANGWEDVVTRTTPSGVALFLNFGGQFARADIETGFGADSFAFFDADRDRRIDLIARADQVSFALFTNAGAAGTTLALSVLGAGGEQNQQGRVVTLVHPDHPETVLARAVDSGSGYMAQNQYELLIGLPYWGSYEVEVTFADRRLAFVAGERHSARAFADGRVEIVGSDADDRLGGSTGADVIAAGVGDDLIFGTAGADRLDGGDGTDTLDFGALEEGVTVDLAEGQASVGSAAQQLMGIENVSGTPFGDRLGGDAGANRLAAGAGDDVLLGTAGADEIDGGDGVDRADYSAVAGPVEIDLVRGEALAEGVVQSLASIEDATGGGFDDWIVGDDGANRIDGGGGTDSIEAGGGDDMVVGSAGADTLDGGEGSDRIDYSLLGAHVALDLEAGTAHAGGEAQTIEGFEDATGTAFADSLAGDAGANRIDGGAGDDLIRGTAGADALDGGEGRDLLDYSALAVAVEVDLEGWARVGDDLQILEAIEDVIGTPQDDLLAGDAAGNRLAGGLGADGIAGRGGDDLLTGSEGADTLDGGEGRDRVDYSGLAVAVRVDLAAGEAQVGDVVQRLAGLEEVSGTDHDDVIAGDGGANRLDGGAGTDDVAGGGGDDLLIGSIGADALDGGEGVDHADYSALASAVGIDLAAGTATVGTDVQSLASIEDATGTGFADNLVGDGGANRIDGGAGDDLILGSAGADRIDGGEGIDRLDYAAFAGGVRVDLAAGEAQVGVEIQGVTGIEEVVGTAQEDILIGSSASDTLDAGAGGDRVVGSAGADALDGGDGDDILDYSGLDAAVTVDLAAGEAIVGGAVQTLAGFEQVVGTALGDALTGDAGRNGLSGGDGDDRLSGGGDGDVLEGGGGADLFLFASAAESADAPDLIADFSQADGDRIDLSALAAGGVAFAFVGDAAFSGTAGEVRAIVDELAGSTTVFADLDGDGGADMEIQLSGPVILAATDFQF
jgi:VCBS repeat-containing protein